MTSYIQLINKINAFCSAHYQIKRFDAEFGEQRPNLATESEEYPYVFMSPTSGTPNYDLNQITVDITCYDIIQKDRANLNTIVSDCHLILTDLFGYYNQGKDDDIIALSASQTPLNNYDLDYVAGWSMTITFELEGWCTDAIPMSPIPSGGGGDCEVATYTITDDEGTTLYSGTIASGGDLTQAISDATATLKDTAGVTISTTSINAEGSADITAPDGTVTITDDSANLLHTVNVKSNGSASQVISDSSVTITDDSANVLHTLSVNAEGSASQVISDSTVTITDDSANTLYTLSVNAEGSANQIISDSTVENSDSSYSVGVNAEGSLTLPDSDVNVNSVNEGSVVSVNDIDINVVDSSGSVTPDSVTIVGNTVTIDVPDSSPTPVGATLMKTGQTTSYRTGDDGDLEAGRATDFFTLAVNNPFGNTNRFTDELGGSTYTNNIVIDWSTYDTVAGTVLGYYRVLYNTGTNVWDDHIDYYLSLTVGTYTSGWRLPNVNELCNLRNFDISIVTSRLNYTPFNITNFLWSSTTDPTNTTRGIYLSNGFSNITVFAKTGASGLRSIGVRTFTVTGTTLT